MAKESWWLKFDRAKEHFQDLAIEIARYTNSHPYAAIRVAPPKDQPDIWLYVLRVTEQPDPRIALIAGDVIHNLRSVLDHLAVAVTGNHRTDFPVFTEDPWETDASGSLLPEREKDRTRFDNLVRGCSDHARTVIKKLQPYAAGPEMPTHPIRILHFLDIADKHRELIATGAGISEGISHVARVSQIVHSFYWPYCADGAEVAKFAWVGVPEPSESEVHVQVHGTPRVTVEIGLDKYGIANRETELAQVLTWIVDGFPEVLEALEPHIKER